jgi:hypothetical protein
MIHHRAVLRHPQYLQMVCKCADINTEQPASTGLRRGDRKSLQNIPLSSAVSWRQDRGDTSQAEGRGFESPFPLQIKQDKDYSVFARQKGPQKADTHPETHFQSVRRFSSAGVQQLLAPHHQRVRLNHRAVCAHAGAPRHQRCNLPGHPALPQRPTGDDETDVPAVRASISRALRAAAQPRCSRDPAGGTPSWSSIAIACARWWTSCINGCVAMSAFVAVTVIVFSGNRTSRVVRRSQSEVAALPRRMTCS